MLAPKELWKLKSSNPPTKTISFFHNLIEKSQKANPDKVLVLTHEFTFQFIDVIANLAKIARQHADEVVAIGYVRRQSDFLVSSYGQWLFRSPERISEAADVMRQNGFDPSLFWGVEQNLIAAIFGNWRVGRQLTDQLYFDWSASLPPRAEALKANGARLSIGLLPRPGFEKPLVSDFLERIGERQKANAQKFGAGNLSFHPGSIEAVTNAIEFGYEMPGPHESNDFMFKFGEMEGITPYSSTAFLSRLKTHIDTVFEAKNIEVSQSFGLNPLYFKPDIQIDQRTIVNEVLAEEEKRARVPKEARDRAKLTRAKLANKSWSAYKRDVR
jgi:hypothetical protein